MRWSDSNLSWQGTYTKAVYGGGTQYLNMWGNVQSGGVFAGGAIFLNSSLKLTNHNSFSAEVIPSFCGEFCVLWI